MVGINNNFSTISSLFSSLNKTNRYTAPSNFSLQKSNYTTPSFFGPSDYAMSSLINFPSTQQSRFDRYKVYRENIKTMDAYNEKKSAFMDEFTPKMDNLKKASQNLQTFNPASVLSPLGYGSTNKSVFALPSDYKYTKTSADFSVKVDKLAQAQQTTFSAVKANDKTDLSNASSNLAITVGGKNYNFGYSTLSKNLTNKDALTSMASQINRAKIGVEASLVEKDGNISLRLESDKTGKYAAFSFAVSGPLSALTGAATTKEAEDAIYSVNGESKTSSSNEVAIADGIQGTLKGVGTTELKKNFTDNEEILKKTKEFVKAYNDVSSFLNTNSNISSAVNTLAYSFSNNKSGATRLGQIGINIDSNGKMTIDEEQFKSSLNNNFEDIKKAVNNLADRTFVKTNASMINQSRLLPTPKLPFANIVGDSFSYSNYLGNMFDMRF